MRDRLNKDVPTMISAYEHGQNAADTANTFKPVRSTPAPCNGANGAMVSWLTAGDTSVTHGGIIVLRGGACAVERAAAPVCWMLDNGRASAAPFFSWSKFAVLRMCVGE